MSRCYYLLDCNGIPRGTLVKLSQMILRFVRGRNSELAYSSLAAPLELGGANCPSLATRKQAYDLKYLSDIISGNQSEPWIMWSIMDIK